MTEVFRSILIKAPIEEVFQYTSDYKNWPDFYEGVSDFIPITETSRGNGTRYLYRAKIFGMNMTVGTEIAEFNENKGWVGKSFKGLEHRTEWIFKRSNENTKFSHGIRYHCPWYMGGKYVDKKYVKPAWIKKIENSLQNLKEILEK